MEQTHPPLTEREYEIVALVAAGRANKQIARELRMAHNTVKNHLRALYLKLGVPNRTAAALWFERHRGGNSHLG